MVFLRENILSSGHCNNNSKRNSYGIRKKLTTSAYDVRFSSVSWKLQFLRTIIALFGDLRLRAAQSSRKLSFFYADRIIN